MKLSDKIIMTIRDPQVALEAANKRYVDNLMTGHTEDMSLHLTPEQNAWLDAVTISVDEINRLAGLTSNAQTQLNAKVNLSGGTMTGLLVLSADPVADLGAATKQYVDSTLTSHAEDMSLHLTAEQNTWLDAITATSVEVNRLVGVTSNIQDQLNAKLNKAGGTMTGALVLSGDPTVDLGAATKQYVDSADDLKVDKAGDTMTGPLTLSGDPTQDLQAATKQYVDDADAQKLDLAGGTLTGSLTLSADPIQDMQAATKGYVDDNLAAHAEDDTLHLTSDQNQFLDAVTVTSNEVNRLSGVTANVQTQLNNKLELSGGTLTGDLTMDAGSTIYVSKAPTASTELVNKDYVDSLVKAQLWEDPILDCNLVNDTISTPPNPVEFYDVYIVGPNATGAWMGLEGHAVYFNGTDWMDLLSRPVAAGDRFGITLYSPSTAGGSFVGDGGKLITITGGAVGAIEYTLDTIATGSTTLVYDSDSQFVGTAFTLSENAGWVITNTSVNLAAGDGLELLGHTLNLQLGDGLVLADNRASVNVDTDTGLAIINSKITNLFDGGSIVGSSAGIRVSQPVLDDIADRVSKTGVTVVSTGDVTFSSSASLKIEYTITNDQDAVNKGYVDAADTTLQDQIDQNTQDIANLMSDPSTKTYIDEQDAKKVDKAGDTMTGRLTLSADPVNDLHAATKQYVDNNLATHAEDETLHLTSDQNQFLDGITVTSAEVNRLAGVTSDVQTQLNSKASLSGGTMTGALILNGDPTQALGAATKQYVDAVDTAKVDKAGDTMTGALYLSADPVGDIEATTKQYVDNNLSAHANDDSVHLTSTQNDWIDAITVTSTEVNRLAGVTGNVQTELNTRLNKTGDTMTGTLLLSADPSQAMQAATKQYVDDHDALKLDLAGGTMSGDLILNSDPSQAMQAATKQYVDSQNSADKDYVDTELATKLNKSGGTMTGALLLNADPTSALGAVTKQYVDSSYTSLKGYVDEADSYLQDQLNTARGDLDGLLADPTTQGYVDTQLAAKLNLSGGTMTGNITLFADPSQAMHPATKQYVDAIAQGLRIRPSVRLATTAHVAGTYNNGTSGVNSTITGTVNGALVVDGVTPAIGDRILFRKQNSALQNGDYVVQQVGNASTPFIVKRVTTMDESDEIPASYFFVYDGATLKNTGWVFTVDTPITFTIGTDGIDVVQFSGQGNIIAGDGMTLDGNTLNVNSANTGRIVVNVDSIDLAVTGVTPGTYTKLVVDGYGRVTGAYSPTTIAGYNITDAQPLSTNLTNLTNLDSQGLIVRDITNGITTKQITVTGGGLDIINPTGAGAGNIEITSNATDAATPNALVIRDENGNFSANVITAALVGNASTATTLANSRNFSATGDVTAEAVSFNGSGNVQLSMVIADTGVTAGSYTKVDVNAKGQVTGGSNPTTLDGYGITDGVTIDSLATQLADLKKAYHELYLFVMSRM